MIEPITQNNLSNVKDRLLRENMKIYVDAYSSFLSQLKASGIPVDDRDDSFEIDGLQNKLIAKGVISRNNGFSFVRGNISGACLDCRTGYATSTFILSLKCNRDCYFCINKNQDDYQINKNTIRDIIKDFDRSLFLYKELKSAAITGGEPLLFLRECKDFIRHAKQRQPDIQIRIYTNGDLASEDTIRELAAAGLDEIRVGIKFDDNFTPPENVMLNIKNMIGLIPRVMVEIPIAPDSYDKMTACLDKLNEFGVYSVNILEFLFPWVHLEDYLKKGYKIKNRPYKVLYHYAYVGGLPIAGSEGECLKLIKHAAEKDYQMGVHYCSLENKLTSQIWHQNSDFKIKDHEYFSPNDYFIKTAVVFGENAKKVKKILNNKGCYKYQYDKSGNFIEFHVSYLEKLEGCGIEMGLSTQVYDVIENKNTLRELALDLVDLKNSDVGKLESFI